MRHDVVIYYIKHVPSGKVIPLPGSGRHGRGGSHVEPITPDMSNPEAQPRFFRTQRAAANYLKQWVRGICVAKRGYDSGSIFGEGESYEELVWKQVPSRKMDEMEICEVWVTL